MTTWVGGRYAGYCQNAPVEPRATNGHAVRRAQTINQNTDQLAGFGLSGRMRPPAQEAPASPPQTGETQTVERSGT